MSVAVSLELDRYIGTRIRLRRRALDISQQTLAGYLGISYQQLQKYESGLNRISASRLHDIATLLKVSVTYFFEGSDPGGLGADPGRTALSALNNVLRSEPDAMTVAEAFLRIRSQERRRIVLGLLQCIVDETVGDASPGGDAPAT